MLVIYLVELVGLNKASMQNLSFLGSLMDYLSGWRPTGRWTVDVVPIASLEAFRALKSSNLEPFRALKPYGQIGGF